MLVDFHGRMYEIRRQKIMGKFFLTSKKASFAMNARCNDGFAMSCAAGISIAQ
jgi:hypothetical protein